MRIPDLSVYDGLPDTVNLTSKDVIKVFGYSPTITASFLYKRGYIPKPTALKNPTNYNKVAVAYRKHMKAPSNRLFWSLGELRKLKKELEK
jgi:hypothetical protein